jgi:hypothetical protein
MVSVERRLKESAPGGPLIRKSCSLSGEAENRKSIIFKTLSHLINLNENNLSFLWRSQNGSLCFVHDEPRPGPSAPSCAAPMPPSGFETAGKKKENIKLVFFFQQRLPPQRNINSVNAPILPDFRECRGRRGFVPRRQGRGFSSPKAPKPPSCRESLPPAVGLSRFRLVNR